MAKQSSRNYDALTAYQDNPLINARRLITDPIYKHYHEQYDIWNNIQGVAKGGTKGYSALYAEVPEKLKQWQRKIVDVFNEESTEFISIFPKGRTDIYKGSQEQCLSKMHALKMEIEKYPALPIVLAEITEFCDQLDAAYKLKGVKKETKGKSSAILDSAYDAMAEMLFSNMLHLTDIFIKNTAEVANFFDFSLIRTNSREVVSENTYTLTVAASEHKVAGFTYTKDNTLFITNTGSVSLFFYGAATADAAVPAKPTEIKPEAEMEIMAKDLGAPSNKYIIFSNTDADKAGEVEIILS